MAWRKGPVSPTLAWSHGRYTDITPLETNQSDLICSFNGPKEPGIVDSPASVLHIAMVRSPETITLDIGR